MKPDPVQNPRRKSGTGLMIMCIGMVAVMLSDSGLFLIVGAVMELAGLAMFIGGMWQQKKISEAQRETLAKTTPVLETQPQMLQPQTDGTIRTDAVPADMAPSDAADASDAAASAADAINADGTEASEAEITNVS